MFVRYYLELPLTADQVEQTLAGAPPAWLESMADAAHQRGLHLLDEAGIDPPGSGRERQVALQLGAPVHLPTMTWLPLRWQPLGPDGLRPRLDATMELAPLGQDRTQLAISARYQPSQAAAGGRIDPGLAQRVAETTLKDFLDQLGHAIVLSHLGPAATMTP